MERLRDTFSQSVETGQMQETDPEPSRMMTPSMPIVVLSNRAMRANARLRIGAHSMIKLEAAMTRASPWESGTMFTGSSFQASDSSRKESNID